LDFAAHGFEQIVSKAWAAGTFSLPYQDQLI
jgi:hypothetical protein